MGKWDDGQGEDWVKETIDSWRHSIWVGVWSAWFVVFKGPWVWYKTIRAIVTLERMHRAFDRGLMTYGMTKGKKKLPKVTPQSVATQASTPVAPPAMPKPTESTSENPTAPARNREDDGSVTFRF